MSSTSALTQFAAEFVTLLVAAAGMAMAWLRPTAPGRTWGRSGALLLGFAVVGTAAFLHGSRLVTTDLRGGLCAMRIAGSILIVSGAGALGPDRRARRILVGGATVSAWAAVAEVVVAPLPVTYGLLAAGSVLMGVALIDTSRRAIAARVAASAAATLLAVILVVSIALSAVISSSVEREQNNRLASQARSEATEVASISTTALENARFAAGDLQGYFRSATPDPLVGTDNAGPDATDLAAVQSRLAALAQLFPAGEFVYATPSGQSVQSATANAGLSQAVHDVMVGSALPPCSGNGEATVAVAQGVLWAIGAAPECLAGGTELGVVIDVHPLDQSYLNGRRQLVPDVSLAFLSGGQVLARSGPQPPLPDLQRVAEAGPAGSRPAGDVTLSSVAIRSAGGAQVATLVLSGSSATVVSARNQLFRALFLIALGGAVLALGLAAVTGDRITSGVRRLTNVAERIGREADVEERARIESPDEVGVLGASFDSMLDALAEQNSALQAAAEDEARLRNRLEAVVGGMTDALIAVDVSTRITEFNAAAERLTGVSAAEARYQPAGRVLVLAEEGGDPVAPDLLVPSEAPWALIATLTTDDESIPVAVSAGPLRRAGGDLIGSVLLIRDLRREREVERMKTEFLSRVGHELRTPLTAIVGYAGILARRDVAPERARSWHAEILTAAGRLLRIVEMLEFFASSGAGRVPLRSEPLDVRKLVEAVSSSWTDRLQDGDRLSVRTPARLPEVVGDSRWLGLAVDELIDNAVKFSEEGTPIQLAASSARRGKAVEISVTDQGRGMSKAEQATAFGEFVQGDSSDTRRFGGLGLGLSLVQRVVIEHGGEVVCKSAPGRGSTFTLRLPASLN